MTPISQRTVLVTGGGGGLGSAICEQLAAEGATVAVADLDAARAQRCVARCRERGARAEPVPFDVGDTESVATAVADVVQRFGSLDTIVNNAAIDITVPVAELRVEDWERIVRTNLSGPFLLSKHALPHLLASGRGHIVNIASTASKRAWANAAPYHATKWGLLGLSHALHAELRPQGVKVTAVVAGGMRTPFLLERFPDLDPGLLQDPANVAQAVRFALSLPPESVIPELMVIPMRETSWP